MLKEEPNNAAAQLSLLDYYRDAKNEKVVEELTQKLLESKKTEKETKDGTAPSGHHRQPTKRMLRTVLK